MGIPAPKILDLFQLRNGSTAVLYQPLPGQTLRQVMQSMGSPAMRQALVERFGGGQGQRNSVHQSKLMSWPGLCAATPPTDLCLEPQC